MKIEEFNVINKLIKKLKLFDKITELAISDMNKQILSDNCSSKVIDYSYYLTLCVRHKTYCEILTEIEKLLS